MKSRYLMLLILAFILSGCTNRFEEYEPYSTFDDRMAAAEQPTLTPDDQMPAAVQEDFATSGSEKYYSSNQSTPSSNQSDSEVPFMDSRSKKQAVNVGAL